MYVDKEKYLHPKALLEFTVNNDIQEDYKEIMCLKECLLKCY